MLLDGKGDSTVCRSRASSPCGLAQVAGPLSALVLIIQKKSLDQNIPQALAVLISCAVTLYQVLTKVQKPPLGCRSFPRHREASCIWERRLLAWAAALRSLTKSNVFGAQLSFRSRLAWPSHCSRGKDRHWFLSRKNVHHDTWVPGVSSWSRSEEETLIFH